MYMKLITMTSQAWLGGTDPGPNSVFCVFILEHLSNRWKRVPMALMGGSRGALGILRYTSAAYQSPAGVLSCNAHAATESKIIVRGIIEAYNESHPTSLVGQQWFVIPLHIDWPGIRTNRSWYDVWVEAYTSLSPFFPPLKNIFKYFLLKNLYVLDKVIIINT